MEAKINIAEILRNKPSDIKLYSPIFGDCTYCYIHDETGDICVKRQHNVMIYFNFEGLYDTAGECLLFPSKEMRDWEKFSWKNGDVLVNSSGFKLLFDRWANDDYTRFFGKFNILEDSFSYETEKYTLVSKDETIDTFEIEKPEFKDGDIVVTDAVPSMWYSKCIFILKGDLNTGESRANSYVFFNINNNHISYDVLDTIEKNRNIHFATDSEKQQLFGAIKKDGKAWDAEKKQIVDLKPKYEFKPMDLCLMKYIGKYNNRGWELCQYAYTEHRVSSSGEQRDFYHSVGGEIYAECIPYNEDTKHLLGTRDEWKGGEG